MEAYLKLIETLSNKAIELILNDIIDENTYKLIYCVMDMYAIVNKVSMKKHIDNGMISV